jgi:hypothetical protein
LSSSLSLIEAKMKGLTIKPQPSQRTRTPSPSPGYRGIGFRTGDQITAKLGIEKTALIRVRADISFARAEAMDEGRRRSRIEKLVRNGAIAGSAGSSYANKDRFVPDSLLEEAVTSEPSLKSNSFVTKKMQGISAESRQERYLAPAI